MALISRKYVNSAHNLKFVEKRNKVLGIQAGQRGAADKLSVENLNGLTPIVDGKDMAQVDLESYVNNLIVYYLDDTLRTTVLGMKNKPSLPAGVVQIGQDAQSFYQSVSQLWLALGISVNNTDFVVNNELLNGDLTVYFQKVEYTNQVNMLYNYAFVDRVPSMKEYIQDTTGDWAQQYYNYLIQNFLPTYPSLFKSQPQSAIDLILKPIICKLDLLDTTSETSTVLRYQLAQALVIDQIQSNISTVANQPAFEQSITQAINDLLNSGQINNTITQLKAAVATAGSAASLASQLSTATSALISWSYPNPAGLGGALADMPGFAPNLRALANDPVTGTTIKNIFGTLALVASGISLGWAYANWNNSNTQTRTKTIFSTVQLFFNLSNITTATGNFFTGLVVNSAEWMINFLYQNNLVNLTFRGYLEQIFETLFTDKWSTFISKRVMPVFLIANMCFTVYDIYQDVLNKNYGAIPFDVIALLATAGQFTLLFVSSSWAGPASAVLALLAAAMLLIKAYVFPTPSAITKFHNSLPTRYTDTSLKIGTPVTGLSNRTMISEPGTSNYINPDENFPSHLSVSSTVPYQNQIKISNITNGYLSLKVPVNTFPAPSVASYYSCRNSDNLCLYSGGPAIETETFVLIAVPGSSTSFYLMAWNSQFIYAKANGQLVLSSANKTAFSFSVLTDWFLPSSFNLRTKISFGQYYGNSTYVIAVLSSGVHVIDITKAANATANLQQYITTYPSAIVYSPFTLNGFTLPSDTQLRLNAKGLLFVKSNSANKKIFSNLVSGKNITFSEEKSLVLPDVLNSGFYLQVVDEDYQIFSHN